MNDRDAAQLWYWWWSRPGSVGFVGNEVLNFNQMAEQFWAIREGLADAPMPGRKS